MASEAAVTGGVDWRRLLAGSVLGLTGDTGSGKSTLAATMAQYCWRVFRKKTRYYAADPGGFSDLLYALILKGIVEVWRVRTRDPDGRQGAPIGTLAQATRGHWPIERDPLTGITRPGVPLAPPYATVQVVICPAGHEAWSGPTTAQFAAAGATCPTCKVMVTMANLKEVKALWRPVMGFEDVGCLIFDSGTGMCEWAVSDMEARAGRDELGGEKGNMKTQHSAGEIFGVSGRQGIGFVQGRVLEWINNSISVPGLVVPPVFTWRKDRGTDQAGLPIYGPKLAGSARTADAPGWMGNCFGVEGPAATKAGYRVYLSQYSLGDGVTNLVKHRAAAAELMPPFLEDPDGATLENKLRYSKFNLGHVLELLTAAAQKTIDMTNEMFPDAPGMGTGTLEVPAGIQLSQVGAGSGATPGGMPGMPSGPPPGMPAGPPPGAPGAKPPAPAPAAPAAPAVAKPAAPAAAPGMPAGPPPGMPAGPPPGAAAPKPAPPALAPPAAVVAPSFVVAPASAPQTTLVAAPPVPPATTVSNGTTEAPLPPAVVPLKRRGK